MIVHLSRRVLQTSILLALFLVALGFGLVWFSWREKTISQTPFPSGGVMETWRPLLGWDKPMTYLVFFQNSAELRPTGGFWGSYAVVTLDKGKLVTFKTDDIYNLDKKVVGSLVMPEAPAPLRQYLKVQRWYLRDANWSPDFPTSARQALDFYKREGGIERLDGVVGVTPDLFTDFLRLLGSVEVAGQIFTPENAVEQLEYFVQVGYRTEGIAKDQRKDVLYPLAQTIIRRLIDKSPLVWFNVYTILEKALVRRDLQMYLVNPQLEQELFGRGWAGEIKTAPGDYLMVVDANLSALKTDPKVQREISYELGSDWQATATIRYRHLATQADWRTTDYKTYLRVYVPKGSKLKSSPQNVLITQELGKTVFALYHIVPLGQERSISFTYELPPIIKAKPYQLLVQRQAGTASYPLRLRIKQGAEPKILDTNLDHDVSLH